MAEEEKTEQATPKKRRDERQKGNVLQSRDITTAVFIFVIFFAFYLLVSYMYERISMSFVYYFQAGAQITDLGLSDATGLMRGWMFGILMIVLPLLLTAVFVNVAVTMFQTRMLFTTEKLKFKFSNLNPINGLKRMFSLRSVVELVKNLLKIIIIGVLVYTSINQTFHDLPRLFDMEVLAVLIYAGDRVFALVWKIALVFAAIAFLDYRYQRWDYEKKLRMTKHEVKQEYKQLEGDPLIKSHRRQEQLKISRARMMQDVTRADVVIRNPTHFSVALRYDENESSAPVLLAKGQDYVALKINEIAAAAGIPFVENAPLARGIYRQVELGQEILPEFYQAAAEVFAWLYRLNRRKIAQ
ncbi:MAG: flagellar biosynthesis protein FlhB [Gracilibacteraceae bacterium]|jgi:flagellar biosynthetic protein FlhB|nr:flagellar biosynthesis protein FlhB [Gracilibacteraceae bacterium]